ncbi:hypothetical protein TKK_0016613 [Trichogramma kaykai]
MAAEENVRSGVTTPKASQQERSAGGRGNGPSSTRTERTRAYGRERARGCLPLRPAADMGTNRRDYSTWPSPGFSRFEGTIRTPPQLRCSSRSKLYLPARGFQGTRTLKQKRKLTPDLPTTFPGHFGLPRRTLLRGPEFKTVPLPGSGIGTGFPFPRRGLGSTDSCATAVQTKPFSTSVLQGLAGVFATTTKICTDGGSRQAHAQTLLRTPPRPSDSSGLHDPIHPREEEIEPHLPLTAEYRRDASAPSIFRASCFGSSAYQNWPTWHSDPFINESLASQFKQARDLTHLKFENRLRSFRPQGL